MCAGMLSGAAQAWRTAILLPLADLAADLIGGIVTIGHRLTRSPAPEKAIDWARAKMAEHGLETQVQAVPADRSPSPWSRCVALRPWRRSGRDRPSLRRGSGLLEADRQGVSVDVGRLAVELVDDGGLERQDLGDVESNPTVTSDREHWMIQ